MHRPIKFKSKRQKQYIQKKKYNSNSKRKRLRLRLIDLYIDRVYLKPIYYEDFFIFYYKLFLYTKTFVIKNKKKVYRPLGNSGGFFNEKRDTIYFCNRVKIFSFKSHKFFNSYFLSLENFWLHFFSIDMFRKLHCFFKHYKKNKGKFFQKKNLFYFVFYRKFVNNFLKLRIKKFRTKYFFYYVKSKRNKILQKYYNIRFFFSNFSKKHFFRKILYFYQFYSNVFFFKRKKQLKNFFILKKFFNSKKSYFLLYKLLNNRLCSYLFNLGFKKVHDLLRKKKIFINGRLSSYKNIMLKNGDFVYLNFNPIKTPYYFLLLNILQKEDSLKSVFFNLFSKNKLKKKNINFLNFFYPYSNAKKSFFINSQGSYSSNMNKFTKYPKKFYLKIFKKLNYLKHKNYPFFKELKIRKNKYFKFKYLIKSKKLHRKKIQKIFKKYKTLYKYRNDQNSMKIFFKKLNVNRLEKRKKCLHLYNSSIYRRLKN